MVGKSLDKMITLTKFIYIIEEIIKLQYPHQSKLFNTEFMLMLSSEASRLIYCPIRKLLVFSNDSDRLRRPAVHKTLIPFLAFALHISWSLYCLVAWEWEEAFLVLLFRWSF